MTSLFRGLIIILLVIGIVLLIQNASNEPGNMVLTWHGYQITTTATFLIAVFNVALILAFYVGRVVSWIINIPKAINNIYYRRKDRHALALIAKGLDARSAGDTKQQAKIAHQITKAMPKDAFATTISAHLNPTEEQLHTLLANPETAFAGHYGLLEESLTQQNWAGAKFHAQAALKKRPNSPKVLKDYFEALLNTNDYPQALELMPKLKRTQILGEQTPVIESAIRLHAAIQTVAENPSAALRQALQAQKACPHFVPAALFRASTLISLGKTAPAERALAEFWHTCPRHDVFLKWLDATIAHNPTAGAEKILKKVEALTAPKLKNPDEKLIANLCIGSAALKFGELDQARTALTEAYRQSANRQVLKELSVLEQKAGDESAASDWLTQAVDAKNLSQPGDNVLEAYQKFRKTYNLDKPCPTPVDASKLLAA